MNDWPSHNRELTRKATEQLSRFTTMYEGGKISKREYFLIISVLYDTTSGLIEMDVSNLMADIHKGLVFK